MDIIELLLLIGCFSATAWVIAIAFDAKLPSLQEPKIYKVPEIKEPAQYKYISTTPVFDGKEWVREFVGGTPEQIKEQIKQWDEITDKNLAGYKKSAKIRGMIALRKKLKEKHYE